MSPFLPGNKRPINKDKDHNPETIDNSLYEKYDMSHTSPDDFTEKRKTKKILMMMTNTRRKLQKSKMVMKLLMTLKLQILCVMIVLSRQPKKKKH